MKALVDKVEPLIWLLFGGGFMVGCLILPAYVFAIGVAAPLGWLPPEALAWERVHGLASHPLGRLVLLALIVLPLWNAMNHLRHYAIDWGYYKLDGVVAPALYALAAVGSLAAIWAVIRL